MSKTIFITEAQAMRIAESMDYTSDVPDYPGQDIRVSEPIINADGETEINAGPNTDKVINMTCPDGFYGGRITRLV